MGAERFGLLFIAHDPESGEMPHGPMAHVAVYTSKMNYRVPGGDADLITPQCVSYRELETWIDDLKRQLDDVKREGKRAFEKEVETWRARRSKDSN